MSGATPCHSRFALALLLAGAGWHTSVSESIPSLRKVSISSGRCSSSEDAAGGGEAPERQAGYEGFRVQDGFCIDAQVPYLSF
jgi:hypothetical protein